tara:strand:- start:742 stop:1140 length:399 start_codon:yes stop_codon:yes gene_type:complete
MMVMTGKARNEMKNHWHVMTLIVFVVMGVGCENSEHDALVEAPIKTTAISAPDPELMRLWMNSCALCHVTGVGGAPIVGKFDDWAVRLEQGNELLLQHTIEGYNNMPPLGYCMACEKDDFAALIEFMTVGTP